jgi:hypothetical protein
MDYGLILGILRALIVKRQEFGLQEIYFSEEKHVDHLHESMDQRRGCWCIVHG